MAAQDPSRLALAGPLGGRRAPAIIIVIAAFVCLVTVFAFVISRSPLSVAIVVGVSVIFGALCFVQPRWVLYVVILASLFSPELTLGESLGPAAKRGATLRAEDLLVVVIVISWLARAAVQKELGLLLRTPLNRPIFAYALLCTLSTALGFLFGWVEQPLGAALFVLKYIQYFVLFFIIVNHIQTPRDARNLVIAGIVTYVAMCIFGLAQIPTGERPTVYTGRPYGEPNTLAAYLVFMVGICCGLMLWARTALVQLFWGVLAALGAVVLAYTLSRSGWLGVAGIITVLVLIGRHRVALVGTLLAIVAFLVFTSFDTGWLPGPIAQRIRETAGHFEPEPGPPPLVVFGVHFDPSATARLRSYGQALSIWFDRGGTDWVPVLTGSGVLGSGKFVDGQYVRVLVETGLLGLVAFLALVGAMWRLAWRAYKTLRTPWYKGLTLGYLAGFAGLILHAVGANTFIIVRIMEPFFIFTGVVLLLPAMEEVQEQRETIPVARKQSSLGVMTRREG